MQSEFKSKTYLQAFSAIEGLISKLKPETSTKIYSCLVALYFCQQQKRNELQYMNKICMMNIDIDRLLKNHVLRFYDLQSLKLLTQIQLYYGFQKNYRKLDNEDTIYVFDVTEFSSIAILYRNKIQAENTFIKINSISPKIQQFRILQDKKIQKNQRKCKQKRVMEKVYYLKKFILGTNQENQEEIQNTQSQVLKVQKNGSITFDINSGFNSSNLSPQLKETFSVLLQNKQTIK